MVRGHREQVVAAGEDVSAARKRGLRAVTYSDGRIEPLALEPVASARLFDAVIFRSDDHAGALTHEWYQDPTLAELARVLIDGGR